MCWCVCVFVRGVDTPLVRSGLKLICVAAHLRSCRAKFVQLSRCRQEEKWDLMCVCVCRLLMSVYRPIYLSVCLLHAGCLCLTVCEIWDMRQTFHITCCCVCLQLVYGWSSRSKLLVSTIYCWFAYVFVCMSVHDIYDIWAIFRTLWYLPLSCLRCVRVRWKNILVWQLFLCLHMHMSVLMSVCFSIMHGIITKTVETPHQNITITTSWCWSTGQAG